MKKAVVLIVFLSVALMSVYAQGAYFDIGFGVGKAWTKIDGEDISADFLSSVTELGVDLGLKAGFGPVADLPLYIVGVIGGIGHRFAEDDEFIQFNSYIIGPGVIFYPTPLVQLAGSLGLSFVANQSSFGEMLENDGPGFAFDISAALDFGSGHHGILLGLRYFGAVNTLEITNVKQNSSAFTVFGRYAFRHRMN